MQRNHTQRPSNAHSIFGDSGYFHSTSTCTGVKVCEWIHPDLHHMCHSKVDESIWEQIRTIRHKVPFLPTEDPQKRAIGEYQAHQRLFDPGNPRTMCIPRLETLNLLCT
ncbi:hypothetical protein V1527DRAFT_36895 [Lipomyces starkeyi]